MQILLVLMTGAVTLAVTLLVQRFANVREHRAVRAQIVALLITSVWFIQSICKSSEPQPIMKSQWEPLRILVRRLGDKDIALTFNLAEMKRLMAVLATAGMVIETCDEFDNSMSPDNAILFNALQVNTFLLAQQVDGTLKALGHQPGVEHEISTPKIPPHLAASLLEVMQRVESDGRQPT